MAAKIEKEIRQMKDPGSAITHFIGMLMALFAAVPIMIRAASNPDRVHVISLGIFLVSMVLLYAAAPPTTGWTGLPGSIGFSKRSIT